MRILIVLGRGIATVLTSALLIVAFTAAMVVVQSGRDEARPAGAALVPGEAFDSALTSEQKAQCDRAVNLYRRGMVSRVILTGNVMFRTLARQHLIEQGLPPQALFADETSESLVGGIRSAASIARAQGFSSVVVVAEPPAMLTALKVARDEGLTTYGSSAGGVSVVENPYAVAGGTWRYLKYIFVGT